jgi:iron(III) transport system substrate-binding protein
MARVITIALLAVLIALPLALRESPKAAPEGVRHLTIITPHGEPTRHEFARAFAEWARKELNVAVAIDWRTPGGTGDIMRYLSDRYRAEFARAYPELAGYRRFIDDAKADQSEDEQVRTARAAFLASEVGVGVDLWFGGGEYPYRQFAARGILVDAGLVHDEPTWFTDAVIPQMLSGETIYDAKGRYYGACVGVFGITSNPDRLSALGITTPPAQWADLAAPVYLQHLSLTDPTKSGAAVTAFERVIQQTMATKPNDLGAGWNDGLCLIKRLVGNARSITDSSSKPTRDVVRGDCVAGMALDFQAKSEQEHSAAESGGASRLDFTIPVGGTSTSADPIGLLRGAPEHDLAVAFIRFVISPAGQRLWNYRVGTPGGPERYALRRLPIRRDVLDAEWQQYASDPEQDPFVIGAAFTYHPE